MTRLGRAAGAGWGATRSDCCSARRTSSSCSRSSRIRSSSRSGSSFHDYFFAAPGVEVDRPFVGFDNYVTVLQDPAVWQSFRNVGVFLIINVPLTVVLSIAAGDGAQPGRARPRVPARQLLRALRHGVRRGRRRLAVPVQRRRPGEQRARPARAGPVVADQRAAGDADHRALRHLEAARVLHPAVPRGAAERAEGAVRVGVDRRRRRGAHLLLGHRPRRAPGDPARAADLDRHRREPLHRAVPADRRRRAQRRIDVARCS